MKLAERLLRLLESSNPFKGKYKSKCTDIESVAESKFGNVRVQHEEEEVFPPSNTTPPGHRPSDNEYKSWTRYWFRVWSAVASKKGTDTEFGDVLYFEAKTTKLGSMESRARKDGHNSLQSIALDWNGNVKSTMKKFWSV